MQMSLVRLSGIIWRTFSALFLWSSSSTQMLIKLIWVKLDIVTHTHTGIFIFHCLEPLQIVPLILGDWEVWGKLVWNHILGFIVPAESLGTIKFTVPAQ